MPNQRNADFDFFIGSWKVHHRRLKERLVGCDDWAEFGGSVVTRSILGGMGNFDDNVLELPEGTYSAVTIRTFDPARGSWSIWWLDGRNPGALDVPMVGSFHNGVGTFLADDVLDGKAIKVRFLWSMPAPDAPRWEQAFSADGGTLWETNWTMDFVRQQ